MNYVEYFNLLGVDAKQIPSITGEGAPTTSTEGAVGCLYMNTLTGDMYKCTAVETDGYVWKTSDGKDGANGADGVSPHIGENGNWWVGEVDTGVKASVEIAQTTGDSEDKVMSQKAVTDELNLLSYGKIEHAVNPINGVESSSTGEVSSSNTRLLIQCKLQSNGPIEIKVNGMKVFPHYWKKTDDGFAYVPQGGSWRTEDFVLTDPNFYFDFVVAKVDNSNIVPSECAVSITTKRFLTMEDGVTVVQTTGDSEDKVMSQKAVTDNFNNIYSAFNVTDSNILNPENSRLGYFSSTDGNFRHVEDPHTTCTVERIPIDGSYLYFASNLTSEVDRYIGVYYFDETGNYVGEHAANLKSLINGNIVRYTTPSGATSIHVSVSGRNVGAFFENVCIATTPLTKFVEYGEVKEFDKIKKDLLPLDEFITQYRGSDEKQAVSQKLFTDGIGAFEKMFDTANYNVMNPSNIESGYYDQHTLNPFNSSKHTRTITPIPTNDNLRLYLYLDETNVGDVNLTSNYFCYIMLDSENNVVRTSSTNISSLNGMSLSLTGVTKMHFWVSGVRLENICFSFTELEGYEPYYDTPIYSTIKMERLPNEAKQKLVDKTVVNFGDSIFGNYRPPVDVSTFIAKRSGATVHNCGFGGCYMGKTSNVNFNAFGLVEIAKAITSGDFTVQDTAITNSANGSGSSLPSYFANSLLLLKSIDFNSVDYITIAYGTNDFTSNRVLDNTENLYDDTTIGGALRYAIETILTTYPHIKIFVCSLIWRFWLNDGVIESDAETKLNGANLKISDYNTKITEVADEYHLPFIDNYSIGFNKFNRSVYFPENDGTHPNETGRELLANHIASKLF